MTALCDFLEDFSAPAAAGASEAQIPDDAELESQRLAAFEDGYRAGWEDAVKAQTEEQAQIGGALGQRLQDLSFTYNEAYGHVMHALTPLFEEMVNTLLPEMARETLGAHVAQTLEKRSREIGACPVEIAVAPATESSVAPLLDRDFGFPLHLVTDETLNPGQADLRFGGQERQIDLGDTVATIREAVAGFAHDNRRKIANG